MPRNKEALPLQDHQPTSSREENVTMEEMKEACERALDRAPLGLRTLAGDISDMRSDDRLGYHAPIVCDRETGRYSYSDPEYSIERFPIGSEELQVDIADYFRHHVGITRSGDEPEKILVAFYRPQANYIITQPLHESQEMVATGSIIQPDRVLNQPQAVYESLVNQTLYERPAESEEEERRVLFRFHLVPNFEFTSQLLGWGPAVEVISPEWLREEIIGSLKASLSNYEMEGHQHSIM